MGTSCEVKLEQQRACLWWWFEAIFLSLKVDLGEIVSYWPTVQSLRIITYGFIFHTGT